MLHVELRVIVLDKLVAILGWCKIAYDDADDMGGCRAD
jgi:hypothetical protein